MEVIIIRGQIFKGVAGAYQVFVKNKLYENVNARKKLRYKNLYVGDFVEFDEKQNVIENVFERKNCLNRPPVANVDKIFIVIANKPKPDFMLVDKLIINAKLNNIKPVLVVNKTDLATKSFLDDVHSQFDSVLPIYETSAKKDNVLSTLKSELKGCLSIFAGQSAVGKSSLLNAILPTANREVGELSVKTDRGKNCTRESQIYVVNNFRIADTTGFSSFELKTISKEQLTDFYDEIKKLSLGCSYNTCNHFGESETICAVKRAVTDGKINKQRYNRYIELFKQLKEMEKKKYG